jgi:hypothetical protein
MYLNTKYFDRKCLRLVFLVPKLLDLILSSTATWQVSLLWLGAVARGSGALSIFFNRQHVVYTQVWACFYTIFVRRPI